MKNRILIGFITFTLLSVSAFIACNKEVDPSYDMKKEFENASLMHNEAMDYVLVSIIGSSSADREGVLKLVDRASAEYVDNNLDFFSPLGNPTRILEDEVQRIKSFREEVKGGLLKSTYTIDGFLMYTIETYASILTSDQQQLLLKINDIIDNESDPGNIITNLNLLLNIESQLLPVEDRNVIYAAASIGIQSIDYWYNNINEWDTTFAELQKAITSSETIKGWFSWRSFAKSDVAGAIGGAIGGALVGSAAAGVGAGPGALAGFVGGGIGTSVTDATMQLIDHYLK